MDRAELGKAHAGKDAIQRNQRYRGQNKYQGHKWRQGSGKLRLLSATHLAAVIVHFDLLDTRLDKV